ncbi:hypothetical protein [Streptomyces sp. NPDC056948]|uniref:hypothetical protein n=1 Tax=Streptomyces sp. NPDC056948 TaxID=3345975 RepID=UPI003644BAA1
MLIGLGISVICALGALVAAAGVVAMAFPGRPEPWLPLLLRRAATMFAWAAVSVYSLGFFAVLESEWEFGEGASSVPARACLDGFDRETTVGLSHHRASYLPLRFDCVRQDGSLYTADPSYLWMNWASMSCALSAAGLAISAGYATEFRARRNAAAS